MKRYKILLVAFFVILATGCSKSYLDRQPLNALSPADVWKTQNDADLALAGCYSALNLQSDLGFGISLYMPGIFDGLSDDVAGIKSLSFYNMQKLGYLSSGEGSLDDIYTQTYKAIAGVNIFLGNVNKITALSAAQMAQYVAEAKFLRAFFYYRLAITFGNVPILTADPNNQSINIYPANASPDSAVFQRNAVLAQVLQDLNSAIPDLPNTAYSGHAVLGSAQVLKLHVLMFQQNFKDAATLGNALFLNSNFSLAANFSDNFSKPGQTGNKEILFSVTWNPPTTPQYPGSDLAFTYIDYPVSSNWVNDVETINGLLPSQDPAFDPLHPYNNRDPRLKKTILCPGDYKGYLDQMAPTSDTVFTGASSQFSSSKPGTLPSGFRGIKFYNKTAFQSTPDYSTISTQDWVIFRLADAYLLYAEALNESSPGSADIALAVNKIRARAGMPNLPAGLSQADMRMRIRRERHVELALENFRYFDLRRWGIAVSVINGSKQLDPAYQSGESPCIYKSNYDFWPIQVNEMNLNPNLHQNPGY